MGALLGLASALAFGVSDFLAGLGARRLHFLWVALLGQSVGVLVAVVTAVQIGGSAAPHAWAWGAASGLGSAVGTLALYRGFGHGEMAVVGPLSAVGAAALPAMVGAAIGDRLPWYGLLGVLLALPAIWLMASTGSPRGGSIRAGVWDGLVAGAGFAFFFIALDLAGSGSGLWPVMAGQVVALGLAATSALVLRPALPKLRDGGGNLATIPLLAGAVGIAATLLYFFAAHAGSLTVAAVLTSVYPGVTVALAAIVIHERPTRRQLNGLALGAVAVVLIVTA